MDFSSHHGTSANHSNNPGRDSPEDTDSIEPAVRHNPFTSPYGSMPVSAMGSSTGLQSTQPQRYFHSRRIKKGEIERPWLDKKDPKEKWVTIIPLIGIFLGLAVTGYLIYDGLKSVSNYKYCPVLDEDFSKPLDPKVWTKEVELGGFGNGQFEMTTNTDENSFIKDSMLHIKPTLTDATLMETNNVINLLSTGECSVNDWASCVAVTNTTNGTVVNPVRSARISTKASAIKYGRVEVTAKLPAGDWLWPAIWMLPVENTYGAWPASGEIDIMESRGNNYTYAQGGNNIVSSTLHWGPAPDADGWYQNNVKREALHTTYAAGFHTYGLEWTEKYVFSYIDTRLLQVLYTTFDKPFWTKGNFPAADTNGSRLVNPWSSTGRDNTPFDEDFYLILNVAVGGTNGWFNDGVSGKPWVDASATAQKDFWNARNQWFPTWEKNGEMVIKSVKIQQQQGFKGCLM